MFHEANKPCFAPQPHPHTPTTQLDQPEGSPQPWARFLRKTGPHHQSRKNGRRCRVRSPCPAPACCAVASPHSIRSCMLAGWAASTIHSRPLGVTWIWWWPPPITRPLGFGLSPQRHRAADGSVGLQWNARPALACGGSGAGGACGASPAAQRALRLQGNAYALFPSTLMIMCGVRHRRSHARARCICCPAQIVFSVWQRSSLRGRLLSAVAPSPYCYFSLA